MSSKTNPEISQKTGDNGKNVVCLVSGIGNKVNNGVLPKQSATDKKKGISKEIWAAIIGGIFAIVAAVILVVFGA